MVRNDRVTYVDGGDHFIVPTRFAVIRENAHIIESTIRIYLDNPKLHPLVKPLFLMSNHMQGVKYCFKHLPIRQICNIKAGVWYPGVIAKPRDDTPVACEYAKVQLITPDSDISGNHGDVVFGPVMTSDRIYLASLTRANDLLTKLSVMQ